MRNIRVRIFAALALGIAVVTVVLGAVLLGSRAPSVPAAADTAVGSSFPTKGAASATPSVPTVAAQHGPPITLRLAIADPVGRQSEPAVQFFVARVRALSNGAITIAPTFNAAGDGPFEEGVATMVKAGDADLGMTASRVWDLAGTTSLQAFQAPMLIDNDALALAVAKSAIAQRALAGMSPAGVVGLALWPEDVRHLFSFPKCGKDFRSAAGIAGATILIIPSAASRKTVAALGGRDYAELGADSRGSDADACRLHGQEAGLVGVGLPLNTAVAVGNVTLFPKYQVLVGNASTFGRLTAAQQAILRQAAADTQVDAYTRQPSEPMIAAQWCSTGGGVILASDAQVTQLVAATRSVIAQMEQDSFTKTQIADILALKGSTPASPGAAACGSSAAGQSPPPSFPVSSTTGYLGSLPPDGTYRMALDVDTSIASGMDPHYAAVNAGIWTLTFAGPTWTASHRGGPTDEDCSGTSESIDGKHVRMRTTDDHGCGFDYDIVWRSTSDGIAIVLTGLEYTGSVAQFKSEQLAMERVWTKLK